MMCDKAFRNTSENIEESAQLAYNRRIMERRVETGCYSEDGLYEVINGNINDPFMLRLRFVDDSCIRVLRDGRCLLCHAVEDLGVTAILMEKK